MVHALAGVPAFALCDRALGPSSEMHAGILHHGDLSWGDVPVPSLIVVKYLVPLLRPASSWTAPPGPKAIRMHPREIRVGLGFVVSAEVPLKLHSFGGGDWRDLRVELPCSIQHFYVEDLFLADGHL